ncbi:hypothetical protein ACFQPC_11045 [Herminiimonas glaciei]|uniref:Lipoprotein n=1 Tax=Herminiimonas glaciei TaxID=523788 RepID=A0ABW2IC03_9BURK
MKNIFFIVVSVLLAGCATSYQSSSLSGGYRDKHVAEDVYRVSFSANGYATRETAQTYWLYRATELTLEKGFDGFEILSPIALGRVEESSPFIKAQMIFIPMETAPKPYFEADIRLLKAPIKANPPKIFNATQLKAELEPHVKGEKKCDMENVCPHIKKYLFPPAATDTPVSKGVI